MTPAARATSGLRLGAALVLLAGCARLRPSRPPAVDFLLVSGDSTYWVTTSPGGLVMRGSPLFLARYDGRFHEIYTADDDHSYRDALLVGQLVFSRDLISGDSLAIYDDTLVARIAHAYAAAHPYETPLDPDAPVDARPTVAATSDVTLLDVHGPYLSLEYHADTRRRPGPAYHATWQRVVDMRAGRPVHLADLVGRTASAALIAHARADFAALVDSTRHAQREMPDLVDLLLTDVRFDSSGFVLTQAGRRPAVQFVARLGGQSDVLDALTLAPIPIDSAAWWGEVAPTLPVPGPDGTQLWPRAGYTVKALADADTVDSVVDVIVADTHRHEWVAGRVHAPVRHIFWLDAPPVDSITRQALRKAFDDATLYDQNTHLAARTPPPRAGRLVFAAEVRAAAPATAARHAVVRRPRTP